MKSESLTTTAALLVLFAVLILIPGSVWGGDGTLLWFPVISEYLKGYETYQDSLIFSGQNLMSIYGELPFWNLTKVFGCSIETTLNLTLFIWVFLSSSLVKIILKGLKGEVSTYDNLLIVFYSLFSPIVFNRVLAGHFNLLYGMLPLLFAMALIFSQTLKTYLLGFLSLWFAFSVQSYQVLIYHIFYLPLLVVFAREHYSGSKKKYFFSLLGAFLFALAFSWRGFSSMFEHAMISNTARGLETNVVYSYTVSQFFDIFNFIFVTPQNLTLARGPGFFHELNYPLLVFLAYYLIKGKSNWMKFVLCGTFLSLFFFSMGLTPFNFLAQLPLIKSFRVPQRSFMHLAFLLPIFCWGLMKINIERKEFFLTIAVMFFGFFVPFFEYFLLVLAMAFPLWRKRTTFLSAFDIRVNQTCLLAISFLISPFKVDHILKSNESYYAALRALAPLESKFTEKERRELSFHFYTRSSLLITSAANTLGFRTYEGYGHPPQVLIDRFTVASGLKLAPLSNQLFFPLDKNINEKLLKEFEVKRKVSFKDGNRLYVEEI